MPSRSQPTLVLAGPNASPPRPRPPWRTLGDDAYRLWADLELKTEHGRATERLRWIPPGRLRMGLPADTSEVDENPRLMQEVSAIPAETWSSLRRRARARGLIPPHDEPALRAPCGESGRPRTRGRPDA